MLSINYPRTYAQTGEIAAYRPVRRPDRNLPIQVDGGYFTLGGDRFPLLLATLVESSALCKVDADMVSTIKRVVSDGFNGVFLRAFNGRQWTESSYNWGIWKYTNTDVSYANRWELEEAALVQLDKMIAWSLDLGIEVVYLDFEGFDENLMRHPSVRALGSYQGRGMYWSSEVRDINWEADSRIILRTSTVTGIRHIDNPRIIWKFHNEDGFSDWYVRSSSASWGGSGSMRYFDKIVNEVTDTFGDNGYWNTELKAKLVAWRDANAPSWVIPAWGKGSTGVADGEVGFPARNTWFNWATGADPATDKANLMAFISAMDQEGTADIIRRMRAENPLVVLNTATTHYVAPECSWALPSDIAGNVFTETHQYFSDSDGIGVKVGGAVTRPSITDTSWSYATNGGGWYEGATGVRSSSTGFIASECGQYSPNRWRYQRMYYEVLVACMHGNAIADFCQSAQYLVGAYICDGRYMAGDNVNVGSPCARLAVRALAPVHRYQMLSENASEFLIQMTSASIATWQATNSRAGIQSGGKYIAVSGSDGSENAVWSGKKIRIDIDTTNTATPTTSADTAPIRVADGTINSGYYVRNTATEVLYYKRPEGLQFVTPYMCGFVDTLREKAAADAIAVMPMYLSNMAAAVNCAVCFLRSDGPYPLFIGPMKLYIHGSDYALDTVLQGSDYAQHAADALGSHNPPGEAYFMANDAVQVWYSGASSQTWGSGAGTAADVRLMMPESFTLHLDTSGMGGTDLEIFGVDKDGIPHRLASSYDSGTKVWSFDYTGAYPEYTVQPKVAGITKPLLDVG